MAKLTLSDLTTLENQAAAIAAINANSALIETALENTLSRDGTSPNAMAADLDMDGNDILNAVVADAVGPPPGLRMIWESATTDTDQGAGKVWANHATLASATVLYLDDVTRDAVSVNDLVDTFDDSTATIRGTITVSQNLDPANFVTFDVTGAVTSASTYSKVAVTYVASGGTLADADNVAVQFVRTGNDGAGAGDVSGPASATADAIVLFDGTGGKTIKDSTYTITAAGAALLDDANAAAQRTTLGLGTGDSPQFTGIEVGHATDTTVTRSGAGDIQVDGNRIYRAGGGGVTAGQLLGADTSGLLGSIRAPFTNKGYESGLYYGGTTQRLSDSATLVVAANRLYGKIFYVQERVTFTRIGIEVTAFAGTNARLGIYNWDPVAANRSLVVDAGTVATGSNGEKEATISQTLMPGPYIVGVVFDNTPTVYAGLVFDLGASEGCLGLSSAGIGSNNEESAFYTAHAFGALPDPFGAFTRIDALASGVMPTIWMRIV